MSAGRSGVWHHAVPVDSDAKGSRLQSTPHRDMVRVLVELAAGGQSAGRWSGRQADLGL